MHDASGKRNPGNKPDKQTSEGLFKSFESILNLETISFTERIEYVKSGFTKKQLSDLKEVIELDWVTLAQLLTVTDRTLHLKKENDLLGFNASDRMMAIAEVYSQGYHLFGDQSLFHDWMQRRNPTFEGSTPVQMLGTITGMDEVKNEIQRLRYGGF